MFVGCHSLAPRERNCARDHKFISLVILKVETIDKTHRSKELNGFLRIGKYLGRPMTSFQVNMKKIFVKETRIMVLACNIKSDFAINPRYYYYVQIEQILLINK